MIQTLSESDFKLYKKWLRSHLKLGPVTVTFTKKDGTERVMECTTNPDLVPIVESKVHETNTDNPINFPKVKKVNEDVMPVYDLAAKAWKSFRWDSVKHVTFTIGSDK